MGTKSLKSLNLTGRAVAIIGLASILSVAFYVAASWYTFRIGFPLDDAWIHQTYARNLAYYGEWSFIRGVISGGSTSPLWSALLAPGFWMGISPHLWTYLLGFVCLWLLGLAGESAARGMVKVYRGSFPWVGVLFASEWHLVWAAVSGMETILYALIILLVLALVMQESKNYILMGLLTGISVWIRPDGITLLGPVLFVAFFSEDSFGARISSAIRVMIGFGVLFAFYLMFNLWITGTPFPNTYYAKQAEYAVLLQTPLYERYLNILEVFIVGAGAVLLPGAVMAGIVAVRNLRWGLLAGFLWVLGYAALYALRLPVTYQHGRYFMPAMPVYFLIGLSGMIAFLAIMGKRGWRWVIGMVWQLALAAVVGMFWLLGARTYGEDVAVIESEMVTVAVWVNQNTPSDALIAAHDIGALGYFAGRDLIDLAGLVSPEVVPFIRDENQLSGYLDQRKPGWLVTFPEWYPQLTHDLQPVFISGGRFAPLLGEENMAVYRWGTP